MSEITNMKCKNCGGEINLTAAVNSTVTCDYCHSVFTLPKKGTGPAALSFLRTGEHELDVCRFDDAFVAYQKAAELDPKEPEAYYGMALATAKVQYLKDLVNKRLQPICHEVSEKKFTADKNYLRALELATPEQRAEYATKAAEIDEIRKKFYELKQSGLLYDCFLCVKVSAEDGKHHTEDSMIALKLYHELQSKGYKPFYSEEETKGRTGADYEALILYALYTSGCMLLVCSDESYLQTPWVRNEYTRFLKMISDEEKERDSITFVFNDSPVERLPGLTGKIQGIKFNSYDALERIVTFVDRFSVHVSPEITRKEYGASAYKKRTTTRQGVEKRQLTAMGGSAVISDGAQLKLVADMMGRRNFNNALALCDGILKKNPSNGEAYLLHFLAENGITNEGGFMVFSGSVRSFDNFEKAIACIQDETRRKQLYELLFERVCQTRDIDSYNEFIVLPDSTEEDIATLTDNMFVVAKNKRNKQVFGDIIKTVTDTDKYISMNLEFAKLLPDDQAIPYYKNILGADEGNREALYFVFASEHHFSEDEIFTFCANPQNASVVEEKLFSFGFNEDVVQKFFDLCMNYVDKRTDESAALFDFVLTMIPKEKDKLFVKYLNMMIAKLFKCKRIKYIAKYNDLLLSIDTLNDSAYFYRVLLKHGYFSPVQLIELQDGLLSDSDFFSAVNSYTEKYPDKNNLYLDIIETIGKINEEITDVECREFLLSEAFAGQFSACRKYEILDLFSKAKKALKDEARACMERLKVNYHCTSDAELMTNLYTDITNEPDLLRAQKFAKAADDNSLIKMIDDIMRNQPVNCKKNVQYRLKLKTKRTVFRTFMLLAIAIAAAVFVTDVIALFTHANPLYSFWCNAIGSRDAYEGFGFVLAILVLALFILLCVFAGKRMRKVGYFVIVGIFAVGISCFTTGITRSASSTVYYGDKYTLKMELTANGEGYKIVSAVDKSSGQQFDLVLPDTFRGKPVTEIGDGAFYITYKIVNGSEEKISEGTSIPFVSIQLPQNLQRIGMNAFKKCENLTSIEIPDTVTYIGKDAFYGCNALESITLPFVGNELNDCESPVVIFDSFEYRIPSNLKNVTVTGGEILDYAFGDCSDLVSVTLGDKVTSIGEYAFYNCNSLESIKIGDGVTSIGVCAFNSCRNLTKISIGSGVTWIGVDAFSDTGYGSDIENFENGALYIGDYLIDAEGVGEYGEEYQVKAGTRLIADYAFGWNYGVYNVVLPDSVKIIGNYAFTYCQNLSGITLGNGLESIGDEAFEHCYSLERIVIPDSVTSIGNQTFFDCSSLLSVTLGKNIASIGKAVFYECSVLESINIPNSVTSIGNYAFYNCTSLKSINIPNGVTSIGNYAFYNCTSLESLTLADGLESIGEYAFYQCSRITSIVIPGRVESIGRSAFYYCSNLESVTLSEGLKSIGESAFYGCSSLEDITMADGLESIGASAFYGCASITNIVIPDSVTSIGNLVFYGCASLESITVPFIGKTVNDTNKFSIIFSNSDTLPSSLKSVTVTGGEIPDSAFYGCSKIESITLPDNLTSIGASAFYGCSGLESITIPDSVTSIGHYAFYDCTMLKSIRVPSTAVIYASAFYHCSNVTELEISFNGDAESKVDKEVIESLSDRLHVTVTGSKISNNAFSWCRNITSVTIGEGVTSIGESAFYACTALQSIELSNGIASIGEYAFGSCSSLESINIPNSVKIIGYRAFTGCVSLKSIIIPESVTSVGEEVFSETTLTVYCVAKTKPEDWYDDWFAGNGTVVWGYEPNTEEE